MAERCERHPFEMSDDFCGQCGFPFCNECLVYSFGPKKPPFCIPCAVQAAGVRSTAGTRPIGTPKEIKEAQRARTGDVAPAGRKFGFRRRRPTEAEPALEEPGAVNF